MRRFKRRGNQSSCWDEMTWRNAGELLDRFLIRTCLQDFVSLLAFWIVQMREIAGRPLFLLFDKDLQPRTNTIFCHRLVIETARSSPSAQQIGNRMNDLIILRSAVQLALGTRLRKHLVLQNVPGVRQPIKKEPIFVSVGNEMDKCLPRKGISMRVDNNLTVVSGLRTLNDIPKLAHSLPRSGGSSAMLVHPTTSLSCPTKFCRARSIAFSFSIPSNPADSINSQFSE